MKGNSFIRVVVLAVMIVAGSGLSGCASRKKTVNKEHIKFKYDASIDSTYRFTSKLTTMSTQSTSEESTYTHSEIDYDGEVGDSLSITNYGADGKMKSRTTVHGKGKAKISSGNQKQVKDTVLKKELQEDTKFEASGNKNISGEAKSVKKTKEIENTGFDFWFWLWILVIIIILVLLYYLNRQFGWISFRRKV